MPTSVRVELGARSYAIRIGTGLLAGLGAACRERGLGPSCLVVSDAHVDPLYGDAAGRSLAAAGFAPAREVVPAGESSKSLERLSGLYDSAVNRGLDRKSFVVALGGGVVGDLAGYLAATYLRGIAYVQVPTSLLAMVDSSVGGKTGINRPQGKNLVGAFHQPALVLTDLAALRTLPSREYVSGLAEVVKYGVISDAVFFQSLEKDRAALKAADPACLERVIARCCEIKADVVSRDEREGGLRAILNFGHTVGHAIEQVTGYGTYLHGEAVAMGMAFAARVSVRGAGLPGADAERLVRLLEDLGLPVRVPACGWSGIRQAMGVDKKTANGVPRFVLAESLGRATPGHEAGEGLLKEVWNVSGK